MMRAAWLRPRRIWRIRLSMRSLRRLPVALVVWLAALACIGPLAYVLVQSLTTSPRGGHGFSPVASYIAILHTSQLWNAFKNTAVQEAIILSTTLFFCPLAGYAYAKFTFRLKGFLFSVTMLTLFFLPIAQTIPLLLEMNEFGWLDAFQGLVIPMTISSLGIFWMTTVIRGVPDELLHAARLNGCGIFSTWWWIVLPTIKPALLALAFFTFIGAYSDFLWPLLVLPDSSMQTVSLYLQTAGFSFSGGGGGGGPEANVVITALPTVFAFFIMKRYFMPALLRRNDFEAALDDGDHSAFQPAREPGEPVRAVHLVEATLEAGPSPAPALPPESSPARRAPVFAGALTLLGLRPWPGRRLVPLLQCSVIACCTLVVFLNALPNSLQLDDIYRVLGNPGIETLAPIWRYFTDPLTSASIPSEAQFRPLLPLSLALNHALTGDGRFGYHVVNLLLNAGTAPLVYGLVRELLGYWSTPRLPAYRVDFLAMAVAALVAVHPLSGMLVSYVSGRDLLLMQLFLCASLLCYALMQRAYFFVERDFLQDERVVERLLRRWFGGSVLGWLGVLTLFEMALLAKAQAIMMPALILAFELTLGRGRLSRLAPYARTLPFALVAAGHLVYVEAYLHFTVLPDAPLLGFDAEWTYPLTQAQLSVVHYLANFAWPFGMQLVPVESTVPTLVDPGVLLGLACIVGTAIWAWRLRHGRPLLAYCLIAYWIAQSPESSFVPMLHNAADYRAYPAGPFLFLALALLLERFLKPATTSALLVALIVYFGVASVILNAAW